LNPEPHLLVATVYSGSMGIILLCSAALLLCMVLLWLISGSETSLFSLYVSDINTLRKDGHDEQMHKWWEQPERLLAILSVSGSFVFLLSAVVSACLFYLVTGERAGWATLSAIFAVLFLLRIFSQKLASPYILRRMAWLLPALNMIFRPLTNATLTHRQTQQKQGETWDKSSEAVIENESILKGIVKFGNIDTHTIMTPSIDVEAVGIDTPFPDLIRLIGENGYSRLPVYDERENVKGILYVKDLLPYMGTGTDFAWQSLLREAYFVPGNKKIDDLLKEFQAKKIHMAVIIDEYGIMEGIVTLEDILEEIVGEIADESDDDEPGYRQTDAHTYLFDGKVLLNDFSRILHLEDKLFDEIKSDADTLAGIILELKGEIPQKGDSVDYKNLSFCVEEMENRRIKQIRVTVHEQKE
jgi:gliding motility-associated protein GldE